MTPGNNTSQRILRRCEDVSSSPMAYEGKHLDDN